MNDLLYTLKIMVKNIRFSLLCISVIAIGIGIILPFYSLTMNVMGKNLPFDQAGRYITFDKTQVEGRRQLAQSLYDVFHYNYFKENSTSFDLLQVWRNLPVSVSDGEYSESYTAAEIEPGLLQLTGIQPVLGRLFSEQDVQLSSEKVVILSFDNWQSYYAGREDIIGNQSRINGENRTIIGVMPEGFKFPIFHDLWVPLSLPQDVGRGEGPEDLLIVGFLKDNVGMSEASSEIQLLQSQITATWSDEYSHIESSEVVPYARILGGTTSGTGVLFSIIVLLVMLNAGNLFFVRGEERLQEMALRSVLGADHKNVARALMLESFLVIFTGFLLGLAIAKFGMNYIEGFLTNSAPGFMSAFWWEMSLDSQIISRSVLVVTLVWLISGGLPAWRISRSNLSEFISSGGKGLTEGGATRINKILINSQLVVSCVLLTTGLLTIMSNAEYTAVAQGPGENFYTGRINYSSESLANGQTAQIYRSDLEQALLSQSNIETITYTTELPGDGGPILPFNTEDQDLELNDIYPRQYVLSVSNSYFDTFGIGLIQGRKFFEADDVDSQLVAIVDQRLVDQAWPDESPIGKRIKVNPKEDAPWLTIVGVVEPRIQESNTSLGGGTSPVLYQPINQSNPEQFSVVFGSVNSLIDFQTALRQAATEASREIPINLIQSFSQIQEGNVSVQNFNLNFGLTFMLIALYLTGITTYGLAARAALRRRTEIGIRLAVGARQIDCLRVFLKDGFRTVIIGLGLGGALAVLGSYALISATPVQVDSLEYLVPIALIVSTLMGSLVVLANYLPARKIVALEPGEALHYE